MQNRSCLALIDLQPAAQSGKMPACTLQQATESLMLLRLQQVPRANLGLQLEVDFQIQASIALQVEDI